MSAILSTLLGLVMLSAPVLACWLLGRAIDRATFEPEWRERGVRGAVMLTMLGAGVLILGAEVLGLAFEAGSWALAALGGGR